MVRFLLASVCLIPAAAHADAVQMLSPIRAIIMQQMPYPAFQGVGIDNFRRIALSERGGSTADRFRDDEVMIWSSVARVAWRLLPPRRMERTGDWSLREGERVADASTRRATSSQSNAPSGNWDLRR